MCLHAYVNTYIHIYIYIFIYVGICIHCQTGTSCPRFRGPAQLAVPDPLYAQNPIIGRSEDTPERNCVQVSG